jgi:hypothetical protein
MNEQMKERCRELLAELEKLSLMNRTYEEINVVLPEHDCDVTLHFPSGKTVQVQCRPSNADDGYNGSLDFILPDNMVVTNWYGDHMKEAPAASNHPKGGHERLAKQLVTELP